MKGLFLTFEGIDGSGKSTHAEKVYHYLKRKKCPVIFTREPGGTPLAEKIRSLILDPKNKKMCWKTELLLYNASRVQHLQEKILPALAAGKIIVCDRFYDATLAYQGYGRRLNRALIAALHRLATGDLFPRQTFILDLPVSLARLRLKETGKKRDRLEKEPSRFQERVRRGYRAVARAFPGRCCLIDATGSLDQTHRKIMVSLTPLLKKVCPHAVR
jgi:dTMP kinase